jgi:hypothetical protein
MIKLPMTAAGHAALEDELRQRIGVEHPRLIHRIQEAIADDTNLAGANRHVCFGPKADIQLAMRTPISVARRIRVIAAGGASFTPESGNVPCNKRCPLRANSGHSAVHSISSSARCWSCDETCTPSALAALRLRHIIVMSAVPPKSRHVRCN